MELLKKYWTYIVIVLLFVILAIQHSCNVNLRSENDLLVHKADSSFLVAKHYLDNNGKLVNQVNTYEATIGELKEHGEALRFDIKQLKTQVGNLNNLVGYWKGKAQTTGSGITVLYDTIYVVRGDTIRTKRINWSNTYLSLQGTYQPLNDTLKFQYTYSIEGFEFTAYRKKQPGIKNLFTSKQLVADIKFGDQNMIVTEFQGVVIKEKPKKIWERKITLFIAGVLIGGYFIN